MKKIITIICSIGFFSTFSFCQIKIGNNGVGGTLGFKNNFSFRGYPNLLPKQKKEIGFELQYSHAMWTDDVNKFYSGLGVGYKWVNLHEINDGFLSNDYEVARCYIPIGIEYFPLTNNNKISIQLETGPQVEFSKLSLDPGRTVNYYYHLRGVLEINYYFRKDYSRK